MIEWAAGGALLALAVGAVWFDVRERRIPNVLTVSALGFALIARSVMGLPELGAGLLGAGICFLLALPFFLAGGLGGGDVKLLAAVGAFLGPGRLFPAFVVMGVVGGLLALAAMVRNGAVRRTFHNLYFMLRTLGLRTFRGRQAGDAGALKTLESPGAITVPYGVAIAAGALFAWFF